MNRRTAGAKRLYRLSFNQRDAGCYAEQHNVYAFRFGVKSTGTTAAIPNMSCAGKSGTTTSNVDVWFVGFTPYYTAGIWGGCDNNQPLKGGTVSNGGTSYHKRIWRNIMTRVHGDLSDPDLRFRTALKLAEVCRKSGKAQFPASAAVTRGTAARH